MQHSGRPSMPPHARRRRPRRPGVARVLVGLILFLALGAGTWQTATGAQCTRAGKGPTVQPDEATLALFETAHDHAAGPDGVVPMPSGCTSASAIPQVDGDSSPTPDDRTPPRTRLARLSTATDPPSLFRPPRSV